jgi:hypothetical protein
MEHTLRVQADSVLAKPQPWRMEDIPGKWELPRAINFPNSCWALFWQTLVELARPMKRFLNPICQA